MVFDSSSKISKRIAEIKIKEFKNKYKNLSSN